MSDGERYHCDRCHDDMAAKFRESHERICAALTAIERSQVEQLIAHMGH